MKGLLRDLQDLCDRKQAMMLGTLIGWLMRRCKLGEQREAVDNGGGAYSARCS